MLKWFAEMETDPNNDLAISYEMTAPERRDCLACPRFSNKEKAHGGEAINRAGLPERAPTEYCKNCEIYFTCEGDEKLLPEVLKWIGDDKMMISGDMPHAERATIRLRKLENAAIYRTTKAEILGENATRFFNL